MSGKNKLFEPKPGWSFHWMPAGHDSYSAYRWLSAYRDRNPSPTEVYFSEDTRIRMWKQGHIRVFAGKNNRVPDKFKEGTIWHIQDDFKHLPYVMVNANESPKKKDSTRYKVRERLRKHHRIFQDSGGYQLISGVHTFLDPFKVAKNHQEFADEGVALDIPMAFVTDHKLLMGSAKVQTLNNASMRKVFGKDIGLIAVSHGTTAKSRVDYLKEILDHSDFDGISLAGLRPVVGLYKPTLQEVALNVLITALMVKDRTLRYHALGVSTYSTMVILCAAAKVFGLHMTCDSARHMLTGAGGTTLGPRLNTYSTYGEGESRSGRVRKGLTHTLKDCNCDICRTIEMDFPYMDTMLLQTHAMMSLSRAYINADRDSDNYLNGIEIPYYSHMQKAINLVKNVKDLKTACELLREEESKRKSKVQQLFTVGGESVFKTRIRDAIEVYGKFYKKDLLK